MGPRVKKQRACNNSSGTITAPSLSPSLSPSLAPSLPPSLYHHHCTTITVTITAPPLSPSPRHHRTITAPSLHHPCEVRLDAMGAMLYLIEEDDDNGVEEYVKYTYEQNRGLEVKHVPADEGSSPTLLISLDPLLNAASHLSLTHSPSSMKGRSITSSPHLLISSSPRLIDEGAIGEMIRRCMLSTGTSCTVNEGDKKQKKKSASDRSQLRSSSPPPHSILIPS